MGDGLRKALIAATDHMCREQMSDEEAVRPTHDGSSDSDTLTPPV